jgi:hypothetical protein
MKKLRVDIRPYFPKIVTYYWENLSPKRDGTIWEWMARDYEMLRVGPVGTKPELWVSFPSEEYFTLFLLRWS